MGLVKYGAIIVEIKGKVGGHVFQSSGSGPVMKPKRKKPASTQSGDGKLTHADAGRVMNPQTGIGNNATQWRNLTSDQRLAWQAAAPDFPFKNKFGEDYTASGYQLFMSVNANLAAIGVSPLTDPPEPADLPSTPSFTVTDDGTPETRFTITGTVPAGFKMVLYCSSAMSPGRRVERGRLKAIAILDHSTVFPYVAATDFVKTLGSLPVNGFFWLIGKLTRIDNGRQCQTYIVSYSYT